MLGRIICEVSGEIVPSEISERIAGDISRAVPYENFQMNHWEVFGRIRDEILNEIFGRILPPCGPFS